MKSLRQSLQALQTEIISIRHQLHANPELAHQEKDTAQLIAKTLRKFGYEVTEGIAGTGVCAVLDSGKKGKTVGLRADTDALPIQEQTNLPYCSRNHGIMHACGHDGHTATLLATAGALTQHTDQFTGKVKFIFQPAEETGTGAPAMIKAGVLENPAVDAIFAYHNSPRFKAGTLVTRSGCMHAAQDVFTITIIGKGGHAAQPQLTIDPIYIGSLIVQSLQSIVSRLTLPAEPVVLSVTQFHAGQTHNVIPDQAILNGSIRTVTASARTLVKQHTIDIAKRISSTFGATASVDFSYCCPPTINHPMETALVFTTAKEVLNKDDIEELPNASMSSEDFSYYLEKVPGCYFWVGTGLNHLRIHSETFEFNDDIILDAAEMLGQLAINYLKS